MVVQQCGRSQSSGRLLTVVQQCRRSLLTVVQPGPTMSSDPVEWLPADGGPTMSLEPADGDPTWSNHVVGSSRVAAC